MTAPAPPDLPIEEILKAVRYVGNRLKAEATQPMAYVKKPDGSFFCQWDRWANNTLITRLHGYTPKIPVIGEERARSTNEYIQKSGRMRWCLDGLDGTERFIHTKERPDRGLYYSVQLGLLNERGVPVWGCAYWPELQELYFVGKDGKAYLQKDNDLQQNIQVRTPKLNEKLVAITARAPVSRVFHKNGFETELTRDSAQHRIARVACGEGDFATVTLGSTVWDSCAMHAILKAAGGDLFDEKGNAIRYNSPDLTIPPHFAAHPDATAAIIAKAEQLFSQIPGARKEPTKEVDRGRG